nr:MAG TPA: hypothetical protein [Caudoviricetes sp.]
MEIVLNAVGKFFLLLSGDYKTLLTIFKKYGG